VATLPAPDAAAATAQPTDFEDPVYNKPVIDNQEDLTSPVPHRKVSGHFDGTPKKFTFYLPPKKQWQGRFFQLVYPLQVESAKDEDIAFGADSGAYTVQTNGGVGYRVDAAAAVFSRKVAADYYGTSRRIYGYIYGGSGGSYQTIGAIENTTGVWDGAVPFIPGTPASVPNSFTVRALARLVLRDKATSIADAFSPGGSGDPAPGLDSVERAMLLEASRMGVPPRAWEEYDYVLGLSDPDGLLGLGGIVRSLDPSYADDFWSLSGYLGTERSPLGDIIRGARIDHTATITAVTRDAQSVPTSLRLDSVPSDPSTTGLDHALYSADGKTKFGPLTGKLDRETKVLTLADGNSKEVLDAIAEGDQLRTDNRWFLALHAYHRHTVPTRPGFYAYDQYRGADGRPRYPQRAVNVPAQVSQSTSGGGLHTGKVNGKVIALPNLLDTDAYPWPGDWYRARVKESMGDRFADTFRVWFTDYADHREGAVTGPRATRVIPFTGILQQALLDVSAWAEKGVAPARSTRYSVDDTQIEVARSAAKRRGIQPVVDLTADGTDRVEVPAGRPVTFRARIEVPPGAGQVVAAEWDLAGTGTFTPAPIGAPKQAVEVSVTHTYTKPGTYFPALRGTAHRDGDSGAQFGRIPNLGRMRVVVR
jgi:hypothetical protein